MRPYFPLAHGVPRSNDLRVISGIIHVIRNGLRWRDAPDVYGLTRLYIAALSGGAGWVFLIVYSAV